MQGVAFDYVQSEGAGSVERLASMMTRAGYGTIIVVGGDSALNHALCGIMQTHSPTGQHPALGVIPNGFGNDFAKYWGFSENDYKGTIHALICRRIRKVDVGTVDVESSGQNPSRLYFLNCINMGVAAAITNLRRKTSSFFGLKTISYFTSALLLVFQRMSYHFSFNLNGEYVERKAITLCIGSSRGYGQTPSAVPYNGLLDITLVPKPPLFQIFHGLWLLFTGRFLSHRGINVWRSRHIQFSNTGHTSLSLDGRIVHRPVSALRIDIMPEEIDFLIK